MPYQALLIDFGGVLTTDLWESIRDCSRREGLAPDTLLNLLRHDPQIHAAFADLEEGRLGQIEFEHQLAQRAGIPAERLLNRMCASLKPDQPMLDEVHRLHLTGIKTGLLSNSWGTGHFDPYEGYGLEELFDDIVISDQVGIRKPDPEIFKLALERLSLTADEAIFIDDLPGNLPPAQDLGITVIHHQSSSQTIASLRQLLPS